MFFKVRQKGMWKTQHMALLAVAVTILSVTLTLYAQSRIKNLQTKTTTSVGASNPIKLMSALSSKTINPDDKSPSSIPPPSVTFEAPPETTRASPKGAGSRWTPL